MQKVLDTAKVWRQSTQTVVLGTSFASYSEVAKYALDPDIDLVRTDPNQTKSFNEILKFFKDLEVRRSPDKNGPGIAPMVADTTLGGNEAINPLFQFGRDDDIVGPLTATNIVTSKQTITLSDGTKKEVENIVDIKGMGRVYAEVFNAQQQLLYLCPGVGEFTDLAAFYMKSGDPDLAKLMTTADGSDVSLAQKIGAFFGGSIAFAVTFPIQPLGWIGKMIGGVNKYSITKYYNFKPAIPLFYQICNTNLITVTAGLGLLPESGLPSQPTVKTGDEKLASGALKTGGARENNLYARYADVGIPEWLREGVDYFRFMQRRAEMRGRMNRLTTGDLMQDLREKSTPGTLGKVWSAAVEASYYGTHFIAYRIEKNSNSTETFTNTTSESPISQELNRRASEARNARFSRGGTRFGFKTGIDVIDMATTSFDAGLQRVISNLSGGGGGVVSVLTGNGKFDIPEIYTDSGCVKSYSFDIELRSPYGNPTDILHNEYVQLIPLLSMFCPRSIGNNAYTGPFLLQGYCKGNFSFSLGIVDTATVQRGDPEYGWSHERLPTVIRVSLSIKDLSPAMFVGIAGTGVGQTWLDIFANNDSMQNYLTTLSGIGLNEQFFMIPRLRRKIQAAMGITKKDVLNPIAWGNWLGNSAIGHAMTAASKWESIGRGV